jgi:hypothetical protein
MKRVIAGAIITLSILAGTATGASAARVKDCGTQEVGPGNSGFTQTETQIASCNSNSNTGEEVGPVTNRGGGTPGGQQ